MTDSGERDYDIGLSFAGDDRDYVERVLIKRARKNTRCFYAPNETAQFWARTWLKKNTELTSL